MSNKLRKQTIRITSLDFDGEPGEIEVAAYVTDDIGPWCKRAILVEEGSGVYREWWLFDDEWTRA